MLIFYDIINKNILQNFMLHLIIPMLLSITCVTNYTFADTLYVDKNEIKIDSSFKGDVINLYGIQEEDGNLIAILKGKKATYFVQKKEKKFGIWLKGKKRKFQNIYRYYSIFSEHQLDILNIPYLLKPFEIGVENISTSTSIKDIIEQFEYKEALFNKKISDGLFVENYHKQVSTSENLIYVQFQIPKNIPEGDYIISVYTIFDGKIQSIHNIPIYIKQSGILKFVKISAKNNKILYFVLSVGFSIAMALIGYYILSGNIFSKIKNITFIKNKKNVLPKNDITQDNKVLNNITEGMIKKKRGRPKKNNEIL